MYQLDNDDDPGWGDSKYPIQKIYVEQPFMFFNSGGSSAKGLTSARALLDASANALEVEAAHYYNGVLLLSDSSSHDEMSKLFLATRDAMLPMHLQLPPPMTAPRNAGPARGLREVVQKPSILEGRIAANVGAVGELPMPYRIRRDLDPPFRCGLDFSGLKLY